MSGEEIAKEIWKNIWPGNKEKIENIIDRFEQYSDKGFSHPILMESASQSGNDPEREGLDIGKKLRFEKQNQLFKYLWLHPKFKPLWHNTDYTDKYGYTALERLRLEYRRYSDDMKLFVKNNILTDIDKIKLYTDYWGTIHIEYSSLFGKATQSRE